MFLIHHIKCQCVLLVRLISFKISVITYLFILFYSFYLLYTNLFLSFEV